MNLLFKHGSAMIKLTVLTKGFAMIAYDDENGLIQQALRLQFVSQNANGCVCLRESGHMLLERSKSPTDPCTSTDEIRGMRICEPHPKEELLFAAIIDPTRDCRCSAIIPKVCINCHRRSVIIAAFEEIAVLNCIKASVL